MKFSHLESFLALAVQLNFSRTAASLNLSQSALSRQIAGFEQTLGVQLFLRTNHRVSLTVEGETLFRKMKPLFEQLSHEIALTKEEATDLKGKLVLASYREVGQTRVFKRVMDFIADLPEVEVDMSYLQGNEMLQGLAEGQVHFAIMSKPETDSDLICNKLFDENLVLATSAANAQRPIPEDIAVVAYRQQDPVLAKFMRKFKKDLGIKSLREMVRVNSHASMLDALRILPGLYAVIPEDLLSHGLQQVSKDHVLHQGLYLLEAPRVHSQRLHQQFKSYLLGA